MAFPRPCEPPVTSAVRPLSENRLSMLPLRSLDASRRAMLHAHAVAPAASSRARRNIADEKRGEMCV